MNQEELFHEDIYSAFRTDVQKCGGFKTVGNLLWPTMDVTKAGERLSQCLTADRPEKLSLAEIQFIKKLAKKKNSFAYISFDMDDVGMTKPQPITPEDEKARLSREVIEIGHMFKRCVDRLEKLA
jgi:hypothetical protein